MFLLHSPRWLLPCRWQLFNGWLNERTCILTGNSFYNTLQTNGNDSFSLFVERWYTFYLQKLSLNSAYFFHCKRTIICDLSTLKLNNELLGMQDEFPCHIFIIIREQNHTSQGIKYNLCNQYTPGKPYIMHTQYRYKYNYIANIKGALQSIINSVWFK